MSIASVGPYHLGTRLGAGGMGEVFAATHTRFRHPAAVKLLRQEAATPEGQSAFEREIRAIAALDHPAVVRIHDRGFTDTGQPWLAMEQASGHVGFPSDWPALQRVLHDVLDALAAAHAAGLLHLDVKPSNVLVRPDGSHVLADFGIVVLRGAVGDAVDGTRWGTPAYMAPERFDRRPERLVEATDLYAVGVLAHHLCSGAPPFGDTTWTESAIAHRSLPPPELLPRFPVPAGLGEWVRTALAKPPSERFQTAAEARTALETLGETVPVVAIGGGEIWAGATLATVPGGDVVPLGELVGRPRTALMNVPPTWPEDRRHRRLEGTGVGLLGLLGVPFVGRTEAREALWDGLVAVSRDRTARSVGLFGPRGVGRTRTGEQFARTAAAAAGARVVRFRGGAREALDGVFAAVGLDAERHADAIALRVRTTDPDVIASIRDTPDDVALLAALRALAIDRTVVFWADDTLASDASSRVVQAVLEARIPGVLTVLAVSEQRRVEHPERMRRITPDTRVDLEPLAPADVRTLLADWVGLQPDVVTEVAELSEGDVGLAIRVVSEAVELGTLLPGPTGLRSTGTALSLPADALEVWEGLLPPLPGLGFALEVAAVLGRDVPRARLGEALGDLDAAERLEHALVEHGLAVRSPVQEDPVSAAAVRWRWASAGLRALVLRDATNLARAHAAAATAYTDADRWVRGGHRLEAGDLEGALPDLFRAASEFIAEGHMIAAERRIDRVRRAMEAHGLPPSDPAWGDLWRIHGVLGPTHQGNQKTWEYNQRALDLSRRHPENPEWQRVRRSCLGGMIWHANIQLLPHRAAEYAREFREVFPEALEDNAHLWENLGWHFLTRGNPDQAVDAFQRALRIADAGGNRHMRFVADAGLGVALCHAGAPEAREHLLRAGDALLDEGFLSARGDVACARGDHYRFAGEHENARHWYQETLRASQEGQARADVGFQVNWALFLRDTGELDAAEREFLACAERLEDAGPTWDALLPLYIESVRGLRGAADSAVVVQSLRGLDATGFFDRDVARALERLLPNVDPAGAEAVRDYLRRRSTTTASAQNTAES